jgi:hypothetical protein
VNAKTSDGKCSEENHQPLYDATTGAGFCCPVEANRYENGKCTSDHHPDPDPDDPDDHCGVKVCPKDHRDLGFEYGSCYKIKDMKGIVLSRRYTGTDYLWDTPYANIAQFQV